MSQDQEPIFSLPPDLVRGPEADLLPLAGEVNWGMASFAVDRLREITKGEGVIVAGIDTGVDRSHPLLTNVIDAKDFTGSPIGAADRNQHGTHISGTIAATDPRIGVAIGAKLIHGKALSDSGSGSGAWIAAAIRWAVGRGAEVISMSLGSASPDQAIIAAMKEAAEKGVWIVAAAGNSGPNTPDVDWPGRSEHCLSVAALDSSLNPASFSSAGAKIDTSGPGVGIWSTKPGGGYQQMSGTSMATPFIAGLLTLYRSALKLRGFSIPDVYQMRTLLTQRSTDTYQSGRDRRTGPGWLNPLLMSVNLTPDPPPVVDRRGFMGAVAAMGLLGVPMVANAEVADPPPVLADPPPVQRRMRTEIRTVTSYRRPIGHTHTCAMGHTWDHHANPTHVCRQCGRPQNVIDQPSRMVAVVTRQEFAVPDAPELADYARPTQQQAVIHEDVQRVIRSTTSGCATGNCPYVR